MNNTRVLLIATGLNLLLACGGKEGAKRTIADMPPTVSPSVKSCVSSAAEPEESVARQWNQMLLGAIRLDFARPTVHARNLFHTSVAMYDAWAAFDPQASTFMLGKEVVGFQCPLAVDIARTADRCQQEQAISYAAYRMMKHRFKDAPAADVLNERFDTLLAELGYDSTNTSIALDSGSPAALGNYIARCMIDFGLQDGSNEANAYANRHYKTVNPPLKPASSGNPDIIDINRWQQLTLETFIDQSGNLIGTEQTPEFLSPEWGQVVPFALTENDRVTFQRDGFDYKLYHDPGQPPYLLSGEQNAVQRALYQWNFALVSIWSAHLDPADGVMWDISPATIGNIQTIPGTFEEAKQFYKLFEGGDASIGHSINPKTGQPYPTQLVPRGDYARVLAEFWADGPDSETPPGHWFVILNHVNQHQELVRKLEGKGEELSRLEWDIKAYFALGGAMHDAAISAWGVKGWYDYIRPISAIRAMAEKGQSSDPGLASYDPLGIPLYPGYIQLVTEGDPLAGENNEHIGKVKLLAWRGPDAIVNPVIDVAGVDWILAENWRPYQRPSFVTPPFAGYVSGHSTYSRAAAEVLTLFTGDEFFPGGVGEFPIEANKFLVFEDGPSVDMVLQWATYRDASDQTSLSRIWGGIHPPADDLPGRLMGQQIGIDAYQHALGYFNGTN